MGRKRLMTVLAGVVAAVGLHIAPAAALDVGVPGVGDASVEVSEDGVNVEADLDADTVVKVDPKVEAEVSPKPKVKVDPGSTTSDSGVSSPAPKAPAPAPSEAATEAVTEEAPTSSGSADEGEVTTAGRSDALEMTPERAARLEAFRAIREADAAFGFGTGTAFDADVIPGVLLAPRSSATDDGVFLAEPEVAPGVEVASPSVAGDQPQSAQLATTPFSGTLPEVPVALQLLAGTLVAGTALAWHLARRELGTPTITRIAGR
jgi:hypothetical protein